MLDAAYRHLSGVHVDSTAATPTPGNALVELRERGFTVLTSGLDTKSNRILVGVKGLAKERLTQLEAEWDARAARGALPARAAVHFWRVGGTAPHESRFESPVTMKGGLELIGDDAGTRRRCTSNVSAGGGVVLTAAHCFGPNVRLFHAEHEVGANLAYDGYRNGSTADVEAIRLHVPRMASRYMFAAFGCNGNLDTCQKIDRATGAHNGVYVGGERVCAGGVGAGNYWVDCGEVQITNAAITYTAPRAWRGTITFNDMVYADYDTSAGSSGAVVGVNGTVHGINSGEVEDPGCLTCMQSDSVTTTQQQQVVQPQVGWAVYSRMANALGPDHLNRGMVTGRTWVGITSAFAGGKCADVQNNLSTNGTPVWSWPCDGGTAQRWSIEPYTTAATSGEFIWWTIKRFDLSSKCMDIDINVNNGARVQEWDCATPLSSSQQTFRFDKLGYQDGLSDPSTFRILSMRTQSCVDLDIAGGGLQSGAKIQQWQCLGTGQRNQYWRSF